MTLRAVVADDNAFVRFAVARLLEDGGVEVVTQVENADALLRAVGEHWPDIAVVDIRMPSTDEVAGIEAAIRIRSEYPGTAVLLLSQYVETAAAMRLIAGGAAGIGYLLKDRVSELDGFIEAVRTVATGGTAMDHELVTRMMERPHRGRLPIDDLTEREREVLALMAEGKSNPAIGALLSLSKRTVETHVSAIFGKFGLRAQPDDDRRVLAVLAYLRSTG
jgi:DNA-binding NarL/FixJ family response regulator